MSVKHIPQMLIIVIWNKMLETLKKSCLLIWGRDHFLLLDIGVWNLAYVKSAKLEKLAHLKFLYLAQKMIWTENSVNASFISFRRTNSKQLSFYGLDPALQ